jgi:hypothetical protein
MLDFLLSGLGSSERSRWAAAAAARLLFLDHLHFFLDGSEDQI